jgi:hypothetical protein
VSSLPRRRRAQQANHPTSRRESLQSHALRLAMQLTPMQRHLVVQAGLPRWLQLPHPYHPPLGRPLSAARALASGEFGVLESLSTQADAYQLTSLGELVAGIWLTAALCDPELVSPVPSR